jgi:hypothetical protein
MTAKTKTTAAKSPAPTTTVCEDVANFFVSCYDWTAETSLQAYDMLPSIEIKAGPGWTAKD